MRRPRSRGIRVAIAAAIPQDPGLSQVTRSPSRKLAQDTAFEAANPASHANTRSAARARHRLCTARTHSAWVRRRAQCVDATKTWYRDRASRRRYSFGCGYSGERPWNARMAGFWMTPSRISIERRIVSSAFQASGPDSTVRTYGSSARPITRVAEADRYDGMRSIA